MYIILREMKLLGLKILSFLFLGSAIFSFAFADMVYLKNGNSLEGIVEKELDNKIILNTGYGKITLDKKDIQYIHRYSLKEQTALQESWKYLYFRRTEYIPSQLKIIAKDFDNLENLREKAIQDKKELDNLKRESEEIKTKLKDLNIHFKQTTDKLAQINPETNLDEYNALIKEFNLSIVKMKGLELDKKNNQERIALLEQRISDYINEFRIFKKRFKEAYTHLENLGMIKEESRYFLEALHKGLEQMGKDFTRYSIEYSYKEKGILVDCLLNGTVKAKLMVDTGASLVILSKQIAQRLGLDTSKERIPLILADGRKTEANPVILESIKVGDLELKNVSCAVLDRVSSPEDGLLGMSFLENFLLSLDVKKNRLILEEFNP
ncbi:MAG: TIGR02281 family clan AA aspartic protease [Candidatus Omnitrophica bacterium]|nr:TIGR02281 family clan AA aspartic protease [Candidatus Omnitrophota bacterium]